MKIFRIKSYCKINLFLRVVRKLNNNYHEIISLITFSNLYDVISISKTSSPKDKVSFSGRFKDGIDNKSNTITKALNLLRKVKLLGKQSYKINIQKNIPHGSGLGGGSANAASLINYFNSRSKIKLNNKKINKIANKVGSDALITLKKKNTFLVGKKKKILRFNKKFRLNLLIVYPNLICSTKKIYQKNKQLSSLRPRPYACLKNKKKLIIFLKNEKNDLERIVLKIYPKIKKIIDFIRTQKGCYFSRITGSGSACFGIFTNMKNAINAKKLIKLKYPKYWCVVSKTI